jgi:hypothetical protein
VEKLELAAAPNSPTDLSASVPNKHYFKRAPLKGNDMLKEDWDEFPQILREMLVAGLVVRRDDGTYALTILGLLEVEKDSDTEGGHGAPAAAQRPNFFLVESATSSPRE